MALGRAGLPADVALASARAGPQIRGVLSHRAVAIAEILAALTEALRERYALGRELGRGGMATVYLARDLRHDRPVALKVLHPELAHAVGSERFGREIRFAARLQHPHILSVHDSGVADGMLWFTMPYVEGESLRDRLRRDGALPSADAVRLAREVAEALGSAHRQGIIHRDIKPENVLLSHGHALVADFGIARSTERRSGAAGEATLTETGMALGTVTYMSPEQAGGRRDTDGRTDIYSLGCMLHELLAGEPPFGGPSAMAVITQHFMTPPPPLRTLRPGVARHIEAAVIPGHWPRSRRDASPPPRSSRRRWSRRQRRRRRKDTSRPWWCRHRRRRMPPSPCSTSSASATTRDSRGSLVGCRRRCSSTSSGCPAWSSPAATGSRAASRNEVER